MKNMKLLIVRIVVVIFVLLVGYGAMVKLSHMAKAPARKPPVEMAVRAEGVYVIAEALQTRLVGYGSASTLLEVQISPEVGGRVVEVYPDLKMGNVVTQGTLLFKIDPDNYQLQVDQLGADVAAIDAQLTNTRQMVNNDQRRLTVFQEILELSRKEYERIRKLTEIEGVESRSRMESQEQELKIREEVVVALENSLDLYPSKLDQLKAQLNSTQARLDKARLDLKKTNILAPFTGRIVMESIEKGQMVSANTPLLSLADDSVIELLVPLEGEEVVRWLDIERKEGDTNWFGTPPDYPVTIRWVERPDEVFWTGRMVRIEQYNPETRSVNLAVKVDGENVRSITAPMPDIPLVDGMFCMVEIPGRVIPRAFKLPRSAVSHNQTVLSVVDGRIETRKVEVARFEEDWAYILSGLSEGEEVLTSRPAVVLDGTKVEVVHSEARNGASIQTLSANAESATETQP